MFTANLISKVKENNVENKMGHFVGWKFGVPVLLIPNQNTGGRNYPECEVARLIFENDEIFRILFNDEAIGVRDKQNFHYELISHKNLYSAFSPRYPVCQSLKRTAYCNSGIGEPQMEQIDTCDINDIAPYSTATLTIDGRVKVFM